MESQNQTNVTKEKFYNKTWFTIIAIIFFVPLGLSLMFKNHKFTKGVRITLSIIGIPLLFMQFVILMVILFGSDTAPSKMDGEPTILTQSDYPSYDTKITYDQLARTPDKFIGSKVTMTGQVVQVIYDDSKQETRLRIAVNDNFNTIAMVGFKNKLLSEKILENDKVTIRGIAEGTISYESTMRSQITIPAIKVDDIKINKK